MTKVNVFSTPKTKVQINNSGFVAGQISETTNNALDIAESALITANSALAAANSINIGPSYDQSNIAYALANISFIQANSALVISSGSYSTSNTTYTYAANNVMLAANSAFTKANAANSIATAGFAYANGVNANTFTALATSIFAYNQVNNAYTAVNASFTLANSAYSKANTALQNTTGTFAGTLTVENNLVVLGNVGIGSSNLSANLHVIGTANIGGVIVDSNGNFGLGITNPRDNTKPVKFMIVPTSNTVSAGLFVCDNFSQSAKGAGIGSMITGFISNDDIYDNWHSIAGRSIRKRNGSITSGQGFTIYSTTVAAANGVSSIGNFHGATYVQGYNVSEYINFNSLNYVQNVSNIGSLTNFYGFLSSVTLAVGGELITNHHDFATSTGSISSKSTITNRYGLYLNADNTKTINAWGVYQAKANVKNYFAGSIGINTTNPTSILHVVGTANIDGNLIASTANISGNLFVSDTVFVANGSFARPSIAFREQPNVGFYLSNTNEITFTANGIDIVSFNDDSTGNLIELSDPNTNVVFSVTETGLTTIRNDLQVSSSRGSTSSNSEFSIMSFSANSFYGGKFFITGKTNDDVHISEILLTCNTKNVFWTESNTYSNVSLFTVRSDIVTNNVRMLITPTSNTNTVYKIIEQRILL